MIYLIAKGGYRINKQKPQIVEEKDCANIIEAKKYCKSLGKEYWCELKGPHSILLSNYEERLKALKAGKKATQSTMTVNILPNGRVLAY